MTICYPVGSKHPDYINLVLKWAMQCEYRSFRGDSGAWWISLWLLPAFWHVVTLEVLYALDDFYGASHFDRNLHASFIALILMWVLGFLFFFFFALFIFFYHGGLIFKMLYLLVCGQYLQNYLEGLAFRFEEAVGIVSSFQSAFVGGLGDFWWGFDN